MIFQLLFGIGRTQAYTVHEGPAPPQDRMDRAEALRFVKDGFSFPAFVTAPVWLAAHKLWLGFVVYLIAAALILSGDTLFGWHDAITALLFAGLHLLVGFEADTIERADLERQGWGSIGAVTGATALECERRFFETWLPRQPVLATRAAVAATAAPVPAPKPKPLATATPAPSGDPTVAGRLAALWGRKR